MAHFDVSQLRSGEGAILTRFSHVGAEILPEVLPDLFSQILLVATEEFETWTPKGGEQVEAHVYAFTGEPAKEMLRSHARWSHEAGIFAIVKRLPDEDARRRCLPNALRPWDPERLGALLYGQLGTRFAHRGVWMKDDTHRRAFVEAAVTRLLGTRGVDRLPNGDATLVLEMPTDSTFEGRYAVSGTGERFSLVRKFADRGLRRTWRIVRGEWTASEVRRPVTESRDVRSRLISFVATTGIFILSIPTFLMVAAIFAWARFSGRAAPVSSSVNARR